MNRLLPTFFALGLLCSMALGGGQVSRIHPRLLGARADLQALVAGRRDAYDRMARIARGEGADDHSQMLSKGLVAAIEGDRALARQAVERALKYVNGPIRKGHETFGHDLALVGLVYDLCHEAWTPEERAAMHRYLNATVDANVDSETHVFHNGVVRLQELGHWDRLLRHLLREPALAGDPRDPVRRLPGPRGAGPRDGGRGRRVG